MPGNLNESGKTMYWVIVSWREFVEECENVGRYWDSHGMLGIRCVRVPVNRYQYDKKIRYGIQLSPTMGGM